MQLSLFSLLFWELTWLIYDHFCVQFFLGSRDSDLGGGVTFVLAQSRIGDLRRTPLLSFALLANRRRFVSCNFVTAPEDVWADAVPCEL